MLSARRSAKWSIPAATVALVSLSIRMKPPSARLGSILGRIGLEHDLAVGRDFGDADRVQRQGRRREMLERVDVDLIFRVLDRRRRRFGSPSFSQYPRPGTFRPPPSRRLSSRTGRRPRADRPPRRSCRRASSPPRPRRSRHRLAGDRPSSRRRAVTMRAIRVVRPDGRTRTSAPGRMCPTAIWPGEAAEVLVGPVHPLHRHAERLRRVRRASRAATVSRCSSRVGPRTSGVRSLRS